MAPLMQVKPFLWDLVKVLWDFQCPHTQKKPAVHVTVAGLGLDEALVATAPVDAFFRRAPQSSDYTVPSSKPCVAELHSCWSDSKVQAALAWTG